MLILSVLYSSITSGQGLESPWYSEWHTEGVRIQNSLPKGGRYNGPVDQYFNCSYMKAGSALVRNATFTW